MENSYIVLGNGFSIDLGFKAGILGYSISEMKAHKK